MSGEHRSIGQVLALLAEEYPDLTISKIRFLESQGLITPERTPSGYRKFYDTDIERLRWVLFQQRDSYLPLKEIKRRLDELPGLGTSSEAPQTAHDALTVHDASCDSSSGNAADLGDDEPETERGEHAATAAPVPLLFAPRSSIGDAVANSNEDPIDRTASGATPTGVAGKKSKPMPESRFDVSASFTATELARAMDVDTTLINDLARMGLITPVTSRSESNQSESVFDHEALLMVRAVVAFAALGVPARNLRMYRVAADREAGVYEQVVATLIARNDRERLRRELGELVDLAETMRRSLLRRLLSPYLG